MRQPLRFDEINSDKNFVKENLLKTPDDSDIGLFLECDLLHPIIRKGKAKNFSFCPECKVIPQDKFSDIMNKTKTSFYKPQKIIICGQIDNKNYLFLNRLFEFCAG